MKIRAIRLREVGCFSEPVVVEGLSGGLDVLADNNEAGKSTLFRAVRTVLLEKHSTAKQDVEALRPYRGGAPLIEIDFEIGKTAYRLRKQFLSAKSALLTDLATGAVKRNADADEEVFRLIGADGGRHPYGLFWVAQEESFEPAAPDERERAALAGIIQREVASITGGRRAQAIRNRAQESLDRLVTRQQLKPRGDYAQALKERDDLLEAIARGEGDNRKAESHFQALAQARQKLAALEDPQAEAERQQAIDAASKALETAERARQQADKAHIVLQLAEESFKNAERKAKDLRDRLELEQRLAGDIARAQEKLTEAEAEAKRSGQVFDEAQLRLDEARREQQEAEKLLEQIRVCEARQRLDSELGTLRDRLGQARQAQDKLIAARGALSRNKLTPAAIKALETEDRNIAILRAGLAAAAPSVRVAYEAGQEGKVAANSVPLMENTPVIIHQPTEFHIAGIGRMTVSPGEAANMREQSTKLQDMLDAHQRNLRTLGAATLEDARHLARERSDAEEAERSAQDQLKILAEKGLDHLQNAVMALELQVAEPLPQIAMTLADGMERFNAAKQALDRATHDRDAAQAAKAEADKARVAAEVRSIDLHKRMLEVAGGLPPGGERAGVLAALDGEATKTRDAMTAAQTDFESKTGLVPSVDEMKALVVRKTRAIEAERNARGEKEQLGKAIANAQGQLTQIFDSGAGEKLDENKEHLVAVTARIQRLEREVAELKLLIETLDACAAEARTAFFEPVVKGLKPLLSLVLPGAEVVFGEKFTPESLSRDGRQEEFERLSGGTREQIAILVRLAFARLAAEAGRPAPVFLDDALVYADDTRIEKLFDALQIAAQAHQIILLTCRTKVFGPLGGNALRIERRDFA
ncbi:MAG: hypothetical protein JNM20_17915 [Rhizobiales bacterium]|nr:hypothetical protein [Hyphomicrobiales bacterium]